MSKSPDIDILGIKIHFPDNPIKLAAFAALLIFFCFIIHLFIEKNASLNINGNTFFFGKVGKQPNLNDGFLLSFWTPSENTKKAYMQYDSTISDWVFKCKSDSIEYGWQCKLKSGSNFETANKKFAELLKNEINYSGYRRYKVIGKGKEMSKLKEGWWWQISIRNEYDEQFIKNFKNLYIEFWNKDANWQEVYLELIGKQKEDK